MSELTVEVYVDEGGEYRWRAKAANGEVVADSAEGYVRRIDCVGEAEQLFPEATVVLQGFSA